MHPERQSPVRILGYSPDLPGCLSTGATRIEVERNMQEAMGFHLVALREEGEPVPEPIAGVKCRCSASERFVFQILVPVIHVPDVRATVEWYESIGFAVIGANEEDV